MKFKLCLHLFMIFSLFSIDPSKAGRIEIKDGYESIKKESHSPVHFHGFDSVHSEGYKGNGQVLTFLEGGVSPKHKQFKQGQVHIIDVSHRPTFLGEDKSTWRYFMPQDWQNDEVGNLINNLNEKIDVTHGNHVIGIAVGQPGTFNQKIENKEYIFETEGGCCPNAEVQNIAYSTVVPERTKFQTNGIGLYTHEDFISDLRFSGYNAKEGCVFYEGENIEATDSHYQFVLSKKESILKKFSHRLKDDFKDRKVDDSLWLALEKACETKGKVINCSAVLSPLCDPLNNFEIPTNVLNKLAEVLEEKDKILILSANNNGNNLSTFQEQSYFKCLANHPTLKKRFLIVVNICPVEKASDQSKVLGTISLKSGKVPFIRGFQSNWPGHQLIENSICAVGSNVLSGWQENGQHFTIQNGTSEAAPVVSSLCTLVSEKYPIWNGVQIIERIKSTAIPFGDQDYTGCGYLWAPAAMK